MPEYQITSQQKEQLLGAGFTRLDQAIPPELLDRLRVLGERLEYEALEAYSRSVQLDDACLIESRGGHRLVRYNNIVGVDPDLVLEILACPAMMAIAREFCGRGAVPLQSDILFKHQHPYPVVLWHQGAPHPRSHMYLNVGIYLDDAGAGDGCLRYVPGTQHEIQDICGLAQSYGWEIPGVVELPARAGDILVQDMMILHGSQPKRTPGVRRTMYVELWSADGIAGNGAHSEEWIELRQRWMGLVLRRASSGDWPDAWEEDIAEDLGDDTAEVAAILARKEPAIPSVYCDSEIETEGYPVPPGLPPL